MAKLTVALLVLAVLLLGFCPYVLAQSPYGLAARQTIPFVMDNAREGSAASTEINIHHPGSLPIVVSIDYFGAVGTATPGRQPCQAQTVQANRTIQFSLRSVCPLNVGVNFGRLELNALAPFPAPDDPAGDVFLANARVFDAGAAFNVEGFPQGNLSGNRDFAVVSGLKSGLVNGTFWRSDCYAAGLTEAVPQVFIRLIDGNGILVGLTLTSVDPPSGIEMQPFLNVLTPPISIPGNYDNVRAEFATGFGPNGGQGGAALFAVCRITNLTFNTQVFEVAKYLDNNDEGRQHHTDVSRTSWGSGFAVLAEVDENDKTDQTNLHVAYFQHPDRVQCEVRFLNPDIPFFDLGQVRLIDPDGTVVAGGPHLTFFRFDLGEKSTRHNGRNGRWLIEVGPDRTLKGNCGHGLSLCSGSASFTVYTVSCSSGNGHSQLDIVGHCPMACTADKGQKGDKWFLCAFDMPFLPSRCYY